MGGAKDGMGGGRRMGHKREWGDECILPAVTCPRPWAQLMTSLASAVKAYVRLLDGKRPGFTSSDGGGGHGKGRGAGGGGEMERRRRWG